MNTTGQFKDKDDLVNAFRNNQTPGTYNDVNIKEEDVEISEIKSIRETYGNQQQVTNKDHSRKRRRNADVHDDEEKEIEPFNYRQAYKDREEK